MLRLASKDHAPGGEVMGHSSGQKVECDKEADRRIDIGSMSATLPPSLPPRSGELMHKSLSGWHGGEVQQIEMWGLSSN